MPTFVGAIDEGTSSARFIIFEAGTANVVCYHQIEIPQITPQEGWVEQDPMLILDVVERCIEITIEKLIKMNGDPKVRLIKIIDNLKKIFLGYSSCWSYKSTRNDDCMGQNNRQTTS